MEARAAAIRAAPALLQGLFGGRNEDVNSNGASSFDSLGSSITGTDSNTRRRGSTTSTTGARTTTRQGTVNQDAIDATVRSVMEGPNGLASIMGAEQGSGGFGSSNAALLTSDLVGRVAGEVGKLTAGSTETVGPQETTSESDDESTVSSLVRGFTSGSGSQRNFNHQSGGGDGGFGCFLSTAACEVMGLDDNCIQLQFLRRFRDGWMKENHPDMVELYYSQGEEIVAYLKSRPDSISLFTQIYHCVIEACFTHILNGKYQEAYKNYTEAMIYLMVAVKLNTKA